LAAHNSVHNNANFARNGNAPPSHIGPNASGNLGGLAAHNNLAANNHLHGNALRGANVNGHTPQAHIGGFDNRAGRLAGANRAAAGDPRSRAARAGRANRVGGHSTFASARYHGGSGGRWDHPHGAHRHYGDFHDRFGHHHHGWYWDAGLYGYNYGYGDFGWPCYDDYGYGYGPDFYGYVDPYPVAVPYPRPYYYAEPEPYPVPDSTPDRSYYSNQNSNPSDPTLANVQSALDNQGYNAGSADGYYGPVTRGAIMQYQTDHGMTADGKLTPELLKSLGVQDPNQVQGQPPPAQNNPPPAQNEQPAPDENTQLQ